MTRVKGYIDSGTCNTVTFSDYSETECGDTATSYYREFIYNNKRVIISNNVRYCFSDICETHNLNTRSQITLQKAMPSQPIPTFGALAGSSWSSRSTPAR